ncbi:MAG TPA: sulfocyanin-like copper-binding protein [Thermoplasmata archaeon]|nr:sulfocyanin-like copper-binding protein [Thermoplasmata archaeon]
MVRRGIRRRALALVIVSLLLAGGLSFSVHQASGSSDIVQAAGSATVSVTASSGFMFTPNGFNDVATNTTVSVTFVDGDTLSHTFSIWGREGVVIPNPASISPDQLVQLFTEYPPLVSLQGTSGQTNSSTFTSPPTGWYEFVCLESGHFQSGMYGFIAFGEALPSNLTVSTPYDGPGAAVFIIIGTIVSLTVIAVVLGFVIGRRRGSSDEMPPERLGYPEPEAPPGPEPLPESNPPPKS